jgi:hypothetical protein
MSSFKSVIPSAGSNATEYSWGAKARNLFGKSRNRPEGDGAQPVFLPDLKRFPQGMTFGPVRRFAPQNDETLRVWRVI